MPRIDEAHVVAILVAARDARLRRPHPVPTSPPGSPAEQAGEPAGSVPALLASAGIDTAEFDRVRAQHRAEMERLAQEHRSALAAQSSGVKDTLRAMLSEQREARRRIPALATTFVYLDTPLFVTSTPGLVISQHLLAPWHSMAKVEGQWATPYPDPHGSDELDFVFVWTNTGGKPVSVTVQPTTAAVGYCAAYANPFRNFTRLTVNAVLNIFEFWNNPPTEIAAARSVQDLVAYGGVPPWLGDYESASVSTAFTMQEGPLLVPPGGTLVTEVGIETFRDIDDGYALADFGSGDNEILVPAVLLGISS